LPSLPVECKVRQLEYLLIYYIIKIAVTTMLIVAIAEIAKRSSLAGAVLASVPLISVMALVWLYVDTRDIEKVSALATSVFWLVLPSLVLFIALPILLKLGVNFYASMAVSIGLTISAYGLMVLALGYYGVKL